MFRRERMRILLAACSRQSVIKKWISSIEIGTWLLEVKLHAGQAAYGVTGDLTWQYYAVMRAYPPFNVIDYAVFLYFVQILKSYLDRWQVLAIASAY